jgi:hypothetical protein
MRTRMRTRMSMSMSMENRTPCMSRRSARHQRDHAASEGLEVHMKMLVG